MPIAATSSGAPQSTNLRMAAEALESRPGRPSRDHPGEPVFRDTAAQASFRRRSGVRDARNSKEAGEEAAGGSALGQLSEREISSLRRDR